MNKHLIIKPRNTGKTLSLINEARDIKDHIIIAFDERSRDYIHYLGRCEGVDLNVISQFRLYDKKIRQKNIFVDEYFRMTTDTKYRLFNLAFDDEINIYAVGTPTSQYYKQDVEICSEWWYARCSCNHTYILRPIEQMMENFSRELMYDFIVHPKIAIDDSYETSRLMLCPHEFEMYYMGKIFKG